MSSMNMKRRSIVEQDSSKEIEICERTREKSEMEITFLTQSREEKKFSNRHTEHAHTHEREKKSKNKKVKIKAHRWKWIGSAASSATALRSAGPCTCRTP